MNVKRKGPTKFRTKQHLKYARGRVRGKASHRPHATKPGNIRRSLKVGYRG